MDRAETIREKVPLEYTTGFAGRDTILMDAKGRMSLLRWNGHSLNSGYRLVLVPFTFSDATAGPIFLFPADLIKSDIEPQGFTRHSPFTTDTMGRVLFGRLLKPHAGQYPGLKLVVGKEQYCIIFPTTMPDSLIEARSRLNADVLRQFLKTQQEPKTVDEAIGEITAAFSAAVGELMEKGQAVSVKIDLQIKGVRVSGSLSLSPEPKAATE